MNDFWGILDRLWALVTWWVVVTPWEQALRVRRGKTVQLLGAGIHLKLPIIDAIYRQSVRLRWTNMPVQTLTTKDGRTLTLSAQTGYAIRDLRLLYTTLHHAEDTVRNICQGALAEYVQTHDAIECTPAVVSAAACAAVRLEQYGCVCEGIQLTDFAFVRTHRLIMDQKWGGQGDNLNTTGPVTT